MIYCCIFVLWLFSYLLLSLYVDSTGLTPPTYPNPDQASSPRAPSPPPPTIPPPAVSACFSNEFRCRDGGCVNSNYRCDRINDCRDQSDEWDCGKYATRYRAVCPLAASARWLAHTLVAHTTLYLIICITRRASQAHRVERILRIFIVTIVHNYWSKNDHATALCRNIVIAARNEWFFAKVWKQPLYPPRILYGRGTTVERNAHLNPPDSERAMTTRYNRRDNGHRRRTLSTLHAVSYYY